MIALLMIQPALVDIGIIIIITCNQGASHVHQKHVQKLATRAVSSKEAVRRWSTKGHDHDHDKDVPGIAIIT